MFDNLRWRPYVICALLLALSSAPSGWCKLVKREKAILPLTFYKGGVMNFLCGFGVPVEELEIETITMGIVFKSQHFLPGSLADLRQPTSTNIHGNTRTADLTNYRQFIYTAMESLLNHLGYSDGKSCLLRSICELAAWPFHHENGLLGEVLHILLTPSTSFDANFTEENNIYAAAEQYGRKGAPCGQLFKECRKSFMAYYTVLIN